MDALTAQQPGNTTTAREAVQGFQQYDGTLFGNPVTARPLPASNVWEVTATNQDGRTVEVRIRLSEQFTAEHLEPGSYTKDALQRAFAAREQAETDQSGPGLQVLKGVAPTAVVLGSKDLHGQLTFDFLTGSFTRFHDIQTGANAAALAGKPALSEYIRLLETKSPGLSVSLIEATSYRVLGGDGDPARRDYGIGVAKHFDQPGVTLSVNVRGGDFNLRSLKDGVSATITLEGHAKLLDKIAGQRTGKAALALKAASRAGETIGGTGGFAWQAKAYYDEQKNEIMLDLGGVEIALPRFIDKFGQEVQELAPINRGHAEVARTNNYQAYVNGENPYTRAVQTREDGQFLNHGDPVADVAADPIRG